MATHHLIPMWADRDDLSDTERAILKKLEEGRCTPAYIAKEIDRSQEYVRERLRELNRLGLVEDVHRGLYTLTTEQPSHDVREEPTADHEQTTPQGESESEPEMEPEPELDIEGETVERVRELVDEYAAENWDDNGRVPKRKEAAAQIITWAIENNEPVGKSSEIVTQTMEEIPVDGQNQTTYWRSNVREIIQKLPTEYSRGTHKYTIHGLPESLGE